MLWSYFAGSGPEKKRRLPRGIINQSETLHESTSSVWNFRFQSHASLSRRDGMRARVFPQSATQRKFVTPKNVTTVVAGSFMWIGLSA